jgi:hypothetical protein
MKIHTYFLVALMSAFFATPAMPQEQVKDPFEKAKEEEKKQLRLNEMEQKNVRTQVEFIDMPSELFTELMYGPKHSANDNELREKVNQLIKDGKANVKETMLSTTRFGLKTKTDSVTEMIYATAYEPALNAENVTVTGEGKKLDKKAIANATATPPTPVEFETRNYGSTVELSVKVDDENEAIALSVVPELVYYVGKMVYSEWKDHRGRADITMPKFYVVRVNCNVVVKDGQYLMIAGVSPKNQNGDVDTTRKLMVFVKCDLLTINP